MRPRSSEIRILLLFDAWRPTILLGTRRARPRLDSTFVGELAGKLIQSARAPSDEYKIRAITGE